MIYQKITDLIGSTPIIHLDKNKIFNKKLNIYAKLEYLNPFGSLKDRIAWEMIKDKIADIKKNNQTIIENSSGNTAKALSIIASNHGIKFKIITNRIKYEEKKDILKITKTKIEELPGKSQCLDPTDPYDPQFFIEKEISKNPNKYYFTNQYFNENNFKAHLKTAEEIDRDLNGKIDYFISGVGTAGSTLGIKKYFKNRVKVIGVICEKGETIPGIRNEKELFSVGLFDKKNLDSIITINEKEAIEATLELIWDFGIITGPTGGASYAAIKKLFKKEEKKLNIVFLACDRFEFYLSYFKKMKPDLFENKKDTQIQIKKIEIKNLEIDKDKLDKLIEKNEAIIVDIRSNFAYKIKSINNSINLPETYLEEIIEKKLTIFPKNKILIFVCPTGDRSLVAAAKFKALGYKAYSLKNGIFNYFT